MSDSSAADGEWTGTRRKSMKENVLLRKNHTGRPRKATVSLPRNAVYGAPPKRTDSGVAACLAWQTEPPAPGVQSKRGVPLPSDSNPKYTYGKSGGERDDFSAVLAQEDKRKYLVQQKARDSKARSALERTAAVARLPGKTTRDTRTQRPAARDAPKQRFVMKRFAGVAARVDTHRDSSKDASAAAEAAAAAGVVEV